LAGAVTLAAVTLAAVTLGALTLSAVTLRARAPSGGPGLHVSGSNWAWRDQSGARGVLSRSPAVRPCWRARQTHAS